MENYTIKALKEMGNKKAMDLKNKLEDENCNLDYDHPKEGIIYGNNQKTINAIEQIYIFGEL